MSNLSQEILQQPLSKLKRILKLKADEYTVLAKLGVPHDYNSNTIYPEMDKIGWKVSIEEDKEVLAFHDKLSRLSQINKQEKLKTSRKDKQSKNEQSLNKQTLIDKDIYIATKELKPAIRNFQRKFRVKQSEIYPFNKLLYQQIEDQQKSEKELLERLRDYGFNEKIENNSEIDLKSELSRNSSQKKFNSNDPYQYPKIHQRQASDNLYNEKSDYLTQRKYSKNHHKIAASLFKDKTALSDHIYTQTIDLKKPNIKSSDRQLLTDFSSLIEAQENLLLDVNTQLGFYKLEKSLKDIENEEKLRKSISFRHHYHNNKHEKSDLEELDYSILERYQNIFEKKALIWQENEIRNTDAYYQRLNYEAIKNNKNKIRNKVAI